MLKQGLMAGMLAGILILGGCTTQSEKEVVKGIDGVRSVSLQEAQLVSGLPGKYLSKKSTIKILFAKPVISKQEVGQEAEAGLLGFDPVISGKVIWTSRTLLEFIPAKPLPSYKAYSGSLHIEKIAKEHINKPLVFNFETIGNEIVKFDGDFRLVEKEKRMQYQLSGKLEFTNEVKKTELEKSLRLNQKGWHVPLAISGGEKGTLFEFSSELLDKSRLDKNYTLTIKKEKLDLQETVKRNFVLAKRKVFKVSKVERMDSGDQSGFVVKFTDSISKDQSPEGFVEIEPTINIKLKVMDNKLYIFGPFDFSTKYKLTLKTGFKSYWGEKTKKLFKGILAFEDIKPALKFTNPGVFLPTANKHSITFQTVNLKQVKLKIFKVFANNIGQFLQTEQLRQNSRYSGYGWNYNLERVGAEVKEQILKIGEEKNKWFTHKLDLKEILKQDTKGLFLVTINFGEKDILYNNDDEKRNAKSNYYYGDDYYTNPFKSGYYDQNGTHLMPVIVSDIGLTVKQAHEEVHVFVTHLETAKPMAGVHVKLVTYQNQLIDESKTDGQGIAVFKSVKKDVFYVEAEKDKQRSVVKLSDMSWNLSGFNTGGIDALPDGIRAFIYTDRGVYRPGDKIFLSMIVRNKNHTFPKDHPVEVRLYNPKNQLMSETTIKKSKDGFYVVDLKTQQSDMTGEWRVAIKAGASTFSKRVKIETVVPNRLKVKIEKDEEAFKTDPDTLTFDLLSTYLFGSPAAGLKAEVAGVIENRNVSFGNYPGYSFIHEGVQYKPYQENILSTWLDEAGRHRAAWRLPDLSSVPSGATAILKAKVYEKGGRFTQQIKSFDIDPYSHYVGLEKMQLDFGYLKIPATYKARIILIDKKGIAQSGKTVNYKLYRNDQWWWWEYRDTENKPLKFKSSSATEMVDSGSIITRKKPVDLELKLEERGEYLLEVQDGHDGHKSGYFFYASNYWGGQGKKDAGNVILKADKKNYQPGEKAEVRFPAPGGSRVLVTLEHGRQLLSSHWEDVASGSDECVLSIPITRQMLPTLYVNVSIIQKHEQTKNDMPLRMYGVCSLNIEDRQTRKKININMQDTLEPGESFEVELKSEDGKPYQATVSIVDVGLLDLTNYKTPDPWGYFFQKLRLGVRTYDLFSQVIGANKDDVYKLFSIGGGEAVKRESMTNPVKAKRFKPVAIFKGPLKSDRKGIIKTNFKMPNYIGAVKVMAVAAEKNAFGHQDKVVPVKKDLMIQPTLPRVIGPDEVFQLPINVITLKDNVGLISLSVETEGPLEVFGESKKTLLLKKASDQIVRFKMKSHQAVGQAKVSIRASAGALVATSATEMAVRPSSPRISKSEEKVVKNAETIIMTIPDDGLGGTNKASIFIQRLPKLNLKHRMEYLIRYPYGCIEQTTSSVFPQLYLKSFAKTKINTEEKIDKNINAGIDRLQKFIMSSGGFAYWPGGNHASSWANNYAGHFLIEAKKLGYHVPDHMMEKWLKYQHAQALKTRDDVMTRVYRVYGLALAGEANFGAMNLLKENELRNMNNVEKWLLASAYQLAGEKSIADEIVSQTKLEVTEYQEFGGTFGSRVRDQAIILEALIIFDRMDDARMVFESIASSMSEQDWYGTQTVAYALLAMGKYLNKIDANYSEKQPRMVGQIALPDGQLVKFDTKELTYQLELEGGFGKDISITLDKATTLSYAYTTLSWSGIPLQVEYEEYEKNMALDITWYDDEGVVADPTTITQGTSLWGHIRVRQNSANRKKIENLALVQVVPSGWEIENLRMTGERLPDWTNRFKLKNADYLDVRDDRLMWFFKMNYYNDAQFLFKVNAITAGEFRLPPTQVEAMYDHHYRATKGGKKVTVNTSITK